MGSSSNKLQTLREQSIDLIVKNCLDNRIVDVNQIAFALAIAQYQSMNFTQPENVDTKGQIDQVDASIFENKEIRESVELWETRVPHLIEKIQNQRSLNANSDMLSTSTKNHQETNSSLVLDAGDRGEDVRKLQAALIQQGANIKADGVFGIKTQEAVQDFQAQHYLKINGIADEKTQEKLNELMLSKEGELSKKAFSSLMTEPSLYDKLVGFPPEIRALHDKLEGYLRTELEAANVKEHHADAMIATCVQQAVEKKISANELIYATVDKNKNLISIFSSTEFKFVCFDAISASRNDPEKMLVEAQQQLEQPQQKFQPPERGGPAI